MHKKSNEVASTLQGGEVHDEWAAGYRTPENEAFYDLSFDYLAGVYGDAADGEVLDAGCGSSTESIQLAKRVTALSRWMYRIASSRSRAKQWPTAAYKITSAIIGPTSRHCRFRTARFRASSAGVCSCTCRRSRPPSPSWRG